MNPCEPSPDITIKDIIKTLDRDSLFSPELFRFCSWMAEYYFANPADCLMAALPPSFKKAAALQYFWSAGNLELIPDQLRSLYAEGRKLSARTLAKLNEHDRKLISRLLVGDVLVERWPDDFESSRKVLAGFQPGSPDLWTEHFAGKRKQPDRFDGIKDRPQLRSDGWSDYLIRSAVQAGVLKRVYADDPLPLLDFIRPRENLRDIELNEQQSEVLKTLVSGLTGGFQPYLLHGVTGAGKTIVYCHLCLEALRTGKTALVLTPEIALTSTALAYFRGFFGDKVTVIHSAMTDGERFESWRGINSGKFRIVVGPRSAVFAPLQNLGVIVVDEEHDGSYKQDDPSPRFHGRDSAIMRAKINNIPIVLGSASPSLESYHNARRGRYQLLKLTERPMGAKLPTVHIVDMRTDRLRGDLPYISYSLKKAVETRLALGQQVILYLNRRGYSPQLKCADCGLVANCPNCRVKLTYHQVGRKLSCHYCGHSLTRYDTCPSCRSHNFVYQGVGTQKVEENIPRLFAQARTARLDSDTAAGRRRAYQILTDFSERKSDLLLGTQMVTKGLDLPHVTLVGVLSADQSLDWPDFRCSEKAFARLLQVAGRSGRATMPGEVIIQTYYPDHEVIADAARQDYETFFDRELASRQELSYPPFKHLVNFVLAGTNEDSLERESLNFGRGLQATIKKAGISARMLGPAPCPMYRLRGRYRRHVFVKTGMVVKFARALTDWEAIETRFNLPSSIRINVDIDPDDMM